MFSSEVLELVLAFPGVNIGLPEAATGNTALMISVQYHNFDAVKTLIARGANFSLRGLHAKITLDLSIRFSENQRIVEKFMMVKNLRNFDDLPNDVRNIILANFIESVGLRRAGVSAEKRLQSYDTNSRWEILNHLEDHLNDTSDLNNLQRIRFLNNLVVDVGKNEWDAQLVNVKKESAEEHYVFLRRNKALHRAVDSFGMLHDRDF